MTGRAVQFDETGLNTLSVPLMVQWRGKDLATVSPKQYAHAKATWPALSFRLSHVGK
jgi:branched-chain amino acid transport system substrate-binding protein